MPPDLNRAFADGLTIEKPRWLRVDKISLHLHSAGHVNLPSGRLGAGDSGVDPLVLAQPQVIPPGRYSVILSIADINTDQRVAFARVQLTEAPVVRWAAARFQDQDTVTLREDQCDGYGVDSGTGSFMSAEAVELLRTNAEASETLMEAMGKAPYVDTWIWANAMLDAGRDLNIVFFSSGYGDGAYCSWWGYGADDALVCLVTDFGVMG